MRAHLCLWAAVVSSLAAPLAVASSVPPLDVATRAARSDRVVVADVVSVVQEVSAEGRPTFVVTTLRIREHLKGNGPQSVEVRQLGGSHGAWSANVPGAARFEAGEQVVAFLRCPGGPSAKQCTVYGLSQGKLKVLKKADGAVEVLLQGASLERMSLADFKRRLVAAPKERTP